MTATNEWMDQICKGQQLAARVLCCLKVAFKKLLRKDCYFTFPENVFVTPMKQWMDRMCKDSQLATKVVNCVVSQSGFQEDC